MNNFTSRRAALLLITFSPWVRAAEPVSTSLIDKVAIGGKDPVSYFSPEVKLSHQVAQGSDTFAVEFKGAVWHFASRASADKFAANPSAYIPPYNGHCSNALATNEGLIRTNGSVWEFFDDKLHLFYAERGRQRWLKGDWQAYRRQADKAWEEILAAKH